MKIAILSQLWPDSIESLKAAHDCRQEINPQPDLKAELLNDAEVVILRSPVKLDRDVLKSAPDLKLIVRAGSGLESIDLDYAVERNITVISIPLSAASVAEHIFGLALSLCRKIPQLHQSLIENRWEKHSGWGTELFGSTFGILGFGRIGRHAAKLANAFQMPLLAYDRTPDKPEKQASASALNVQFVELDELFANSDVISIQTPLNNQTQALIGQELIDQMKPNAILINVGRGGIVDETALFNALSQNKISGAALDVFSKEPPFDSPLLKLDNFVGTPHVGAQTQEAQRRVGEDVVRVINAFEKGMDLRPLGLVVSSDLESRQNETVQYPDL